MHGSQPQTPHRYAFGEGILKMTMTVKVGKGYSLAESNKDEMHRPP